MLSSSGIAAAMNVLWMLLDLVLAFDVGHRVLGLGFAFAAPQAFSGTGAPSDGAALLGGGERALLLRGAAVEPHSGPISGRQHGPTTRPARAGARCPSTTHGAELSSGGTIWTAMESIVRRSPAASEWSRS